MAEHSGQCLCGQVKYNFAMDPLMSGVCHCKNANARQARLFLLLLAYQKPHST